MPEIRFVFTPGVNCLWMKCVALSHLKWYLDIWRNSTYCVVLLYFLHVVGVNFTNFCLHFLSTACDLPAQAIKSLSIRLNYSLCLLFLFISRRLEILICTMFVRASGGACVCHTVFFKTITVRHFLSKKSLNEFSCPRIFFWFYSFWAKIEWVIAFLLLWVNAL